MLCKGLDCVRPDTNWTRLSIAQIRACCCAFERAARTYNVRQSLPLSSTRKPSVVRLAHKSYPKSSTQVGRHCQNTTKRYSRRSETYSKRKADQGLVTTLLHDEESYLVAYRYAQGMRRVCSLVCNRILQTV